MKSNIILFSLLLVGMLIIFQSCGTTASVNSIPLMPQERNAIHKMGIVFSTSPRYSVHMDFTSGPPTYHPMLNVALHNSNLSFGQKLGYVAVTSFMDALGSALENSAKEKEISLEITELMNGWDYDRSFSNTLFQYLNENGSIEVCKIDGPLKQEEIIKNTPNYLKNNIDAIMDIHLTTYGLNWETNGTTVFASITVEIINAMKKEVVASSTFKFDLEVANKLHDANKQYFILLSKDPNNQEYIYRYLPFDSIFLLPITINTFDEFFKNGGALFKQELKLAALQMSRELTEYFGFAIKTEKKWRDEFKILIRN